MSELSKTQEARVVSALIKFSDKDGRVDFKDQQLGELLGNILSNGNYLDHYLYDLNGGGILDYEEIGEDGFAPIIICSVSRSTHEYLEGLLWQINEEVNALHVRITDILTFDPALLAKEIENTERKLSEVKASISSNELLKPLEKPVNAIAAHFDSAKLVAESYEDIFKNIVRPVQEEGRQGVKTTVRWAIISIIVSVALSWVISNWTALVALAGST